MQTFGLTILVLIAAPSLAWHLLCAGRWLRRRLWPTFSERVDRRFRPYNPHPLRVGRPLTEEEKENLKEKFTREFNAKPNKVLELGVDRPLTALEKWVGEETSVASRLSVGARRAVYRMPSPPSSPDTGTPAETPPLSSTLSRTSSPASGDGSPGSPETAT